MENTLWDKINKAGDPLAKFRSGDKITACIYPIPYEGISEVVRWFYSRNNACQVFFACSLEISNIIEQESWADVSYTFTIFVEYMLMPYCVEHTNYPTCCRRNYEYDKKVPNKQKDGCEIGNYSFDFGCQGTTCHCEPFGEGDFTNGIAQITEFIL